MLRILLVNHSLKNFGGTECYIRDVAAYMRERGHQVLIYSPVDGIVSQFLRKLEFEVVNSLSGVDFRPDLIHAHHCIETTQAMIYYPDVPLIYFTHGAKPWQESPPALTDNIRHFICVSEITKQALRDKVGMHIDDRKITVLPNFVDENRFKFCCARKPENRFKAIYIGRGAKDIKSIRQACENLGIILDEYGPNQTKGYCDSPESLLSEYSICFAYGRSAMEALFCGLDVILCYKTGSGDLVTSDNFEELKGKNFGYSCCQELNSVKDFEQQISRVLRQGSEGVPFLLNDDMRISFAAGPILEKLEHLYLDITSNFQDDNFRSQSAVPGRKDFKASLSEFLSKIQSDVLEYKYKLIRSHREVDKLNSLLSHCNEKSSQQSKTINDYEIQISDLKKTLAICKKDLNSEKSRGFLLETRLRKKSNNTKNLKKKLHAYSNLIDSSIEFSKAQSNQLEGQDSEIQHKSDTIIRLKNQSKNLHSQISELKESYLQMSSKYSTLRRVIPDVMISLFKFLDSHSNKLKRK